MGRTTDVSSLFLAAVFVDGAFLPLQIEAHTLRNRIERQGGSRTLNPIFWGMRRCSGGCYYLAGAPTLHYEANGTLEHKEALQRATSHPRARDDKAASGDVNQWMKATRRDSRAKCRR